MPQAMSARTHPHPLDDLPLYLPRLFYTFLGVIELKLAESRLDSHLRPGMAHVLLRLYESDNCIIKDIGRSLRVANGTLTSLLNRMHKAGLIQCRRCRNDGRATRVTLTPLGRSLEPRVHQFHREMNTIVAQGFTAAEIASGKSFMARMLDSLRSAEESLRLKPENISPNPKRRSRPH